MKNQRISLTKQLQGYQNLFNGHDIIAILYQLKQRLCHLLSYQSKTKAQCVRLVKGLLRMIDQPIQSSIKPFNHLAKTLESWQRKIARMWRFTKSNGITEGFHRKMKLIQRRAYGFRNFENYGMRVSLLCG